MPKGMTKKQMGGINRPKFLSKFPKIPKPNFQNLKSLFTRGKTKKGAVAQSQGLSIKTQPPVTAPINNFNYIIHTITTNGMLNDIDSNSKNNKDTTMYALIKGAYNRIESTHKNIISLSSKSEKDRYSNILPNMYTRVVLKDTVKLPHNYTHIHYTAWPDHGVPKNNSSHDYVMLHKIIEQLFEYKKVNTHINVLVHCSAGVGRTGTFIMMCYLYNEIIINNNKSISNTDIFKAILLMRILRNNYMVQTEDQYIYIIGYMNYLKKLPGRIIMESLFNTPTHKHKIKNKPLVNTTHTTHQPINSYINANYINNCSNIDYPFAFFNKIIAAQGPIYTTTTTTIDDFNKMIAQEGITHVIMVTNLIENRRDKCAKYFTEDTESQLPNIKYNNVLGANTSNDDNYTIRDGTITFNEQEQESALSLRPTRGGARKYRSKKANNNKRSKVCKTKKHRGGG